jgi:hypothetical protein
MYNLSDKKNKFLIKATNKHHDKYDYSNIEYKDTLTKIQFRCKIHNEIIKQLPYNHLRGNGGCKKCLKESSRKKKSFTIKEFIQKSKKKHGDYYEYSKVSYTNSVTPVIIICPVHGEFHQKPVVHYSGSGCNDCGIITAASKCKTTCLEFIKKARETHNNKYDYSNVDYQHSHKKIKIICPVHGEFEQLPSNHLTGSGCLSCGILSITGNKDDFINKATLVHDNKYDYSKVNYVTNRKNIIIICPVHGEFHQTPYKHLNTQGCSKCSGNRKSDTLTFIEKAKTKHNNKYDYSKVNYENNHIKVTIICEKHGEFKQVPNSHLNGHGCNKCQYCPCCLLFPTNGRICSYCKPKKNNKLYQKTKEYKVVEYMRNNIDKEFFHNKSVGEECTKNDRENTNGHLYPDLRWDCGWFQLILEVDEFKHRGSSYKCDERRMFDILSKLGMRCIFIRYNPDHKESNLDILKKKIETYILEENKIGNSELNFSKFGLIVEYLFY